MENFENWNKNVRGNNLNNSNENLNSDKNANSKTNPTQNIDQNNNQRDYDKEPLILRDYTLYNIASSFLFVFIFSIIAFLINPKVASISLFYSIIVAVFSIKDFIFNRDIINIYFLNSKIQCKYKSELKKEINIDEIIQISKAIFVNHGEYKIQTNVRVGFIITIGFVAIFAIAVSYFKIFSIFFIIFIVLMYVSKFILNKIINHKFSFKSLKEITIFDKDKGYINFIVSNTDYLELKNIFC